MKRQNFLKRAGTLPAIGLRTLVFVVCGLLSVFLLASGYESLYSRSLPFIHTLDTSNLTSIQTSYDLETAFKNTQEREDESIYGKFGAPTNLKLPGRSKKLDIVMPLRTDNQWLARADTLHLLTPAPARNGNLGIAVLYCRASFRTLQTNNLPAEGSNIFMDTDHDWRYVYKVTSTTTTAIDKPYVPADNGSNSRMLIICNQDSRLNVVIEASLLSVQGIER